MQTQNPSWIPASPRERVFLFALAIALMLNTTVVMLLLTGDLPVLGDLLEKPAATAAAEAVTDERDTQAKEPQPVLAEDPAPQAPLTQDSTEPTNAPTPLVSVTAATPPSDPISPVQQAQPKQDEPPVTFFGVGLE